MTTGKSIEQMTPEEKAALIASLQKQVGAAAPPAPVAAQMEEVTVDIPEGLGVTKECETPGTVVDLLTNEVSGTGGRKFILVCQVSAGEFQGEFGKLHSSPQVMMRKMLGAGLPVKWDAKTKRASYSLTTLVGKPVKLVWRKRGGFVNLDDIADPSAASSEVL